MQTKENKISVNFRPILIAFLSLVAGISLARSIYSGDWAAITVTVAIFVFLILFSVLRKKLFALLIALLFFFGGNGIYFLAFNSFMGKEYANAFVSGRVCLVDEEEGFITLENVTANTDSVSGVRVKVYGGEGYDFEIGDIVMFEGKLDHANMFSNGLFNSFLYRQNVAYNSYVSLDELSIFSGDKMFDERVRESIHSALYSNMDKNSADIAYAVLTGEKSGIDDEIMSEFRGAGIVHLLTVSGLHISFLIMLITFLLKKMKVNRFINFVIVFVMTLIYAMICGFAPSIIRAMIMGLVMSLASLFGRQYDGLNSLSVAGILTLCVFPLFALDVGFLMSYGCVFAIIMLYPPLNKIFKKFLPRWVASMISVSLAAEIGVLPFASMFSSTFNFLSVISNFIAVPYFILVFTLLIVFTLLNLIFPCGILFKVCDWGFAGLIQIAKFFSATDVKIITQPFNPLFIALYLCIIFVASYFFMASGKTKWVLTLLLTTAMALLTMITPSLPKENASVNAYSPSAVEVIEQERAEENTIKLDGVKISFTNLDNVGYNKAERRLD